MSDRRFPHLHELRRPSPHDPQPIIIVDNPSREFFWPVTVEDVLGKLSHLPDEHLKSLTHIWLRRCKRSDFAKGVLPFAAFCCGSGVCAVILYPWPRSLTVTLSANFSAALVRDVSRWCVSVKKDREGWVTKWDAAGVRAFYLDGLLLHEIGHHVDRFRRRWTRANLKQAESAADGYAAQWSSQGFGLAG